MSHDTLYYCNHCFIPRGFLHQRNQSILHKHVFWTVHLHQFSCRFPVGFRHLSVCDDGKNSTNYVIYINNWTSDCSLRWSSSLRLEFSWKTAFCPDKSSNSLLEEQFFFVLQVSLSRSVCVMYFYNQIHTFLLLAMHCSHWSLLCSLSCTGLSGVVIILREIVTSFFDSILYFCTAWKTKY